MRKLMWLTIGFALGCGICTYGGRVPGIFPDCFLLAGSLGLLVAGRKWAGCLRPGALLLGCALSFVWFAGYNAVYLRPVLTADGQERNMEITVTDYSVPTNYGARTEGTIALGDRKYSAAVYLREETELAPGDTVAGIFRFRVTAPEGNETSSYFYSKGIFLVLYQAEEITVEKGTGTERKYLPVVLAGRIGRILEETFPADTQPFAKALLLGDTSNLDYETDTALKISGIRHVVAVSGLHISILYSLICLLTVRKPVLTALMGIPVLLLFSAVAGFTPSVTRACVMILLMLLAQLFERDYDPPTALSASVLLMLLVNPTAIASVSLQLSAGCVAGILLFQQPVREWLLSVLPEKGPERIRNVFCTSVSVTISAMSLTTPLSAYYFGMVSLVGVLTNFLTLWVVTLVFNGIVAVCALHLLWAKGAAVLAAVLSWPIRFVLTVAELLADFPVAAVYTESGCIVAWLVFVYLLLAVFLAGKEKRPGVLLCCGCIGLCAAMLAAWTEPRLDDSRFTVLDVGQGQSILLQSSGKTFLVDCGGDDPEETADLIAEELLSQGITTLDGIVLTHYDADHADALSNLLCRVDTKLLVLPDTHHEGSMTELPEETVYVWEDLKLTWGDDAMTVYGPVYSGSDNENSLCVLFDTQKCDILITGDRSEFGERMLLRRTELPDVDVLVAGHHGAADSTSEQLLAAVTPETVVISVGENNIYDHPAPALLQRLEDFGCRVFRTDRDGKIIIRR